MTEHISPIPSRLYNAAVGGHVAGADQIIDDKTGLTLDKVAGGALEEKEYISDSNNGMGRVVLRKNLVDGINTLVQTMINKSNTIYIIQYDFTLGENITIPANCILEFDGGSISGNGTGKDTITADVLNIKTNSKIFSGIKFNGNCKYHSKVYLSWFISEYPVNYNDLSVDNTAEVRDCFASGALQIVFPFDKFIHLTDTIHVTTAINILTEGETYEFPNTYGGNQQLLEPTNRCCVFSNNVTTLFDYKIAPVDGTYTDPTLSIGNIYLLITKDFNDLSDKDVPVLNIETNGTELWGVNIYCDIKAYWKRLTIDGQTDTFQNYTGIQLKTINGAMSYIKINGYLQGLYRGVYAIGVGTSSDGNWMTDITINGNSRCIYGGLFENVGPITIYGSHQCCITTTDQTIEEGYFTAPGYIKLFGHVWDCYSKSERSTYRNCAVPIMVTGYEVNTNTAALYTGVDNNISWVKGGKDTKNLILNRSKSFYNVLNYLLMNRQNFDSHFSVPEEHIYTVDDIDILSNPSTLKNIDCLFDDNGWSYRGIINSIFYSNICYLDSVVTGSHNLTFKFTLNHNYFNYESFLLVLKTQTHTEGTITIRSYNDVNDKTIVKTVTYNGSGIGYYSSEDFIVPVTNTYAHTYLQVEINLTIGTNIAYIVLPNIQLLSAKHLGHIKNKYIPNVESGMRIGLQAYDFANKKPIWWDGTAWKYSDGTSVSA